ncbi:hypothetical protein J2Y73_001990 [Peribacillus frigoritolerans]|nr:hypothetical protein [Peribacillus frigoritolerans]
MYRFVNVPNALAENAEHIWCYMGFFFKFLNDYYDTPSRPWTFASGLNKVMTLIIFINHFIQIVIVYIVNSWEPSIFLFPVLDMEF